MGFKTRLQRDLDDRFAAVLQPLCGSLQAEASDVLLERFTHQAVEHTMKVESGEVCDGRQLIQVQVRVQMLLDVNQRADDAFVVILLGSSLHARAVPCFREESCGQASRAAPKAKSGKIK